MASFNKIPMFSKEDYDDWKIRMQAHLAAQDDDMWFVITDGPMKIMKANTAVGVTEGAPQMIEKHRSEWTAEDKKKANLDNVAKDILYKTLDKNMFAKIKTCTTAKEIWEKLTQLCEGNDQTKENKLTVAIQKFDNAKMKPGETLAEFDERFSSIIIELTSLGKEYSDREISLKVMRALPRECDVKTIAMRESKDLNKLELHDLFADLKAYEFELGIRTEEEPSTTQQTKALAAATVTLPVEESTSKKSAEQLSNEAMSLFVKKFGCFNCGKKGHFIAQCNKPKKDEKKQENRRRFKNDKKFIKKKNQKVLVAEEDKGKWAETESEKSSSEESSSESEDERVECLLAKEDQEATDEMVFDFNSEEFTREDLVTALHDMVNEFKGLYMKFNEADAEKKDLKNKLTLSSCSQHKEVESLKVKLSLIAAENDDLRRVFHATLKENKLFLSTINMWNKSSASLDKIHEMQKPAGDRTGLGYDINDCNTSEASTQPVINPNNIGANPGQIQPDTKGQPDITQESDLTITTIADQFKRGSTVLTGYRSQNTYRVEWNDQNLNASTCFVALNGNKNWLWHKRLNHLNFKSIATISKLKLVSGLPNVDFAKDKVWNACQLGKQVRSTFKSKGKNSSTRCLDLLHMDLFGPIPVMSLGGKKYTLVVIDDYSRFTWVLFLGSKDQTADHLIKLLKRLHNEKRETSTESEVIEELNF
ncbi:uncharacterized protein [Primulina eburnea]|uniref:uncharacterized protein n=1 Tax=Primulina eburnea TaxID=1245227 RepID=UPI003C6C8880